MPITQERQTIQDLRAAGFTEEQAVLLAAKFEATAQAGATDLKSFMSAENERLHGATRAAIEQLRTDTTVEIGAKVNQLRTEIGAEVNQLRTDMDARFGRMDVRFGEVEVGIAQMEARFEHSLRIQLATILSAIVGVTGLAVAIITLTR